MSKTNHPREKKIYIYKHNLRVTLYLTRLHPWTLFRETVLPKQPKKKEYPTYNRCITCIVTTEYKKSSIIPKKEIQL